MTIENLGRKVAENAPAILTGFTVLGTAMTAVLAAKAAVKATDAIREQEFVADGLPIEKLSAKEKVHLTWKYFVPTSLVGSATIVCAISAQSINTKKTAIAMGLYTLTDRALTEYQEKAQEVLGEVKENSIREAIAKDRFEKDPPPKELLDSLEIMGGPASLYHDVFSGRYFVSDNETLRRAQNTVNADCINHMYASLNDYYSQIGLGAIEIGEALGWTPDHMLELEINYAPSEDGRPCGFVGFKRQPKADYYSFG